VLSDEEGFPHEGVIDFANNRTDLNSGNTRIRALPQNLWVQTRSKPSLHQQLTAFLSENIKVGSHFQFRDGFFRHELLRPMIWQQTVKRGTLVSAGKNRLKLCGDATWEGIFRSIARQ